MIVDWLRPFTRAGRIERQAIHFAARLCDDPVGTRPDLQRWLAADPSRRAILDALLDDIGEYSVAARTLDRSGLWTSATTPPPSRLFAPPRWVRPMLAGLVAAAMLTVVVAGQHDDVPVPAGPTMANRFATANAIRTFPLPDGSMVILDARSSVSVALSKNERRLTLERGRARFSVAHDPARPFIVQASGGTITAHGTIFDVWVRPDRQVRVVLMQGRVDVQVPLRATGSIARPHIQLTPGQRFVFGEHDASRPSYSDGPQTAAVSDGQWTDDMMAFDDVPLRDVLMEVNARSDLPIVLEAPDLADTKIIANLKRHDPMALARNIGLILELEVTREASRIVLHKRLGGHHRNDGRAD